MIQYTKYSKYSYGFPAHDIDPKIKEGKEYCLTFAQAFYSLWLRNEFVVTYRERDEMFVLRKYGVGDQAEDTVMRMCYGTEQGWETVRKGWMNVNWEILKIAGKYRNAFLGIFSDIEFDILCESQDAELKKAKEDKAWEMYALKKMRPILEQQMGVKLPEGEEPEPDSVKELETYLQHGVYKNQFEVAAQRFLKECFSTFSNWELDTKRMVGEDLWDIGRCLVQDTIDRVTQKIKIEYCDIANAPIRLDHEGRILDGGIIKIKSIADVRSESVACGHPISEDDLMEAGMAAVGYYGNPLNWEWGRDQPLYNQNMGWWVYDNWKVAVLECEYRTSDTQYYTEKTKEDKKSYYTEKYGKEWKESGTKKTITKSKINYYRAKWLIGTEHVYDYGQQYDIPRPDKSEAMSSFHYIKIPGFSPVKNMRPILDQVQLAWVKFQNAWAKARPDGWMYDESVLINSTLGSKLKPDQLVRMAEQTGRLFIKSTNKWNHATMSPNAGNPLVHMPGGIGEAGTEFINTWNLMIGMLQEMTGLTPQASASPLPADTGKGVSEIALASTTNVLKPMVVTEYKKLKQSIAKTTLLRGMLTFKFSKEICKDYYDILGETTVEILKTASKTAAQLGINLVPKTTAEIKQELKQAAQMAMQIGRDGIPQLDFSEYLLILDLIEANASPDYIRGLMGKMIMERQQKMEQDKQQLIKLQSDGNMQAAMVATEGEKEKLSFETQEKMKLSAFETQMKIIEDAFKTKNVMDANTADAMIQHALTNMIPQTMPQVSPQQNVNQ